MVMLDEWGNARGDRMASHATTSNAPPACQARQQRLIPYWDRFLVASQLTFVSASTDLGPAFPPRQHSVFLAES